MSQGESPSSISLRRDSLLTPDVAVAWLGEIANSFGGCPTFSGDGMRRLLSAGNDILLPLLHALAPTGEVAADGGIYWLQLGDGGEISFDPDRSVWETSEALGYDIDGLLSRIQRQHSRNPMLGPLDGSACLAACLGLAFLEAQEQRLRRKR